jgi:hypothetical protein
MATFLDMQTRLGDDLINESITTDQIKNAIRAAIKQYGRKPFWFLQTEASFPTVASQEYYSASDFSDMPDIKSIHSVVLNNSGKSKLKDADYGSINALQNGMVTGSPSHYTYYKKQMRLYPIPDAAYTVTVSYSKQLAELSADADENDWTNEAEELIRQCAKGILALDTLHDTEMAARFSIRETKIYDSLLEENRRREPKKTLTTNIPVMGQSFNIASGD